MVSLPNIYNRLPTLTPTLLHNRIYTPSPMVQHFVRIAQASAREDGLFVSRLTAPIATITAVALSALIVVIQLFSTLNAAICNLAYLEGRACLRQLARDVKVLGADVLFVGAGTVAAMISMLIPSVTFIFNERINFRDLERFKRREAWAAEAQRRYEQALRSSQTSQSSPSQPLEGWKQVSLASESVTVAKTALQDTGAGVCPESLYMARQAAAKTQSIRKKQKKPLEGKKQVSFAPNLVIATETASQNIGTGVKPQSSFKHMTKRTEPVKPKSITRKKHNPSSTPQTEKTEQKPNLCSKVGSRNKLVRRKK